MPFISFTGPLGEPVHFRAADVTLVRGIALTVGGRPAQGSLVVLSNREAFRVQGHPDVILAGVVEATRPPALTNEVSVSVDPAVSRSVDQTDVVLCRKLSCDAFPGEWCGACNAIRSHRR